MQMMHAEELLDEPTRPADFAAADAGGEAGVEEGEGQEEEQEEEAGAGAGRSRNHEQQLASMGGCISHVCLDATNVI